MTKSLIGLCAPTEPPSVHVTVDNDYFLPFVIVCISFALLLGRYVVDTRTKW